MLSTLIPQTLIKFGELGNVCFASRTHLCLNGVNSVEKRNFVKEKHSEMAASKYHNLV